jgi:YHS domain-containing protein
MKNLLTVMVVVMMAGLMCTLGCKKKAEPMPEMDMSGMAGQAEQTAAEGQKTAETAVVGAVEQTMCPIMDNNPINKDIFVEYKGKKVYFCCNACVAEFNKDPEKYAKDLPQFKQ